MQTILLILAGIFGYILVAKILWEFLDDQLEIEEEKD